MQNDNLKSYLHLHLIVFIWGFTAVLGELISVREASLVWYRMGLATLFLLVFVLFKRGTLALPVKAIIQLTLVGVLIAVHWIFFFKAINVANVSITLAMFSTGAFFAALLEPLFFNRKVLWYEVLFGLIIIASLSVIMKAESGYLEGVLYALFSVFVGVLFTIFNGKLIQKYDSSVITLYEFFAGFLLVSVYLFFESKFTADFFTISAGDWILILVLASICTTYAFTASVGVMKSLSPYTVSLTTNLEPVYGIFLAYLIIGEAEKMSVPFYISSVVILITVILNGLVKQRTKERVEI